MLSDDLAVALEPEARRRRLSVSAIAGALEEHLGLGDGRMRPLPWVARGRSGHRSTGRDLEEAFADEWSRDRDR